MESTSNMRQVVIISQLNPGAHGEQKAGLTKNAEQTEEIKPEYIGNATMIEHKLNQITENWKPQIQSKKATKNIRLTH